MLSCTDFKTREGCLLANKQTKSGVKEWFFFFLCVFFSKLGSAQRCYRLGQEKNGSLEGRGWGFQAEVEGTHTRIITINMSLRRDMSRDMTKPTK